MIIGLDHTFKVIYIFFLYDISTTNLYSIISTISVFAIYVYVWIYILYIYLDGEFIYLFICLFGINSKTAERISTSSELCGV